MEEDHRSFQKAATALSRLYTSNNKAYANGIQHACANIENFLQQQTEQGQCVDGRVALQPLKSLLQLLCDLSTPELQPDIITTNERKRSASPSADLQKKCRVRDEDDS